MCLSRAGRYILSAALLIYASLSAAAATGGSSHCPDKSSRPDSSFVKEYGDICYEFRLERLMWTEANASCARRRGVLATVDSRDKQEFLADVLQSDRALTLVWIGARITQPKGAWIWEQTGQPLTYSNWATFHPKNDFLACGSMGRDDKWQWQSVYCESNMFMHSYICQYDGRSAGGLLSDLNNVIGLAVGLCVVVCLLVAIVGVVACMRTRRRRREARRRSLSGDSAEQKISNIDGSYKHALNTNDMLNIGPAPPAYGQVTNLQSGGGGEPHHVASTAAQPLLLQQRGEQQRQQVEQCSNDPLASNLASHSSQASKLQDKCLSELISADYPGPATAPAAAASTQDAATMRPVSAGLGDGGQAASSGALSVATTADRSTVAAEPADGEAEEARALLRGSNDLS